MNKTLLLVTGCFFTLVLKAQDYESIKTTMMFNQYDKAKENIDKSMTDAKFIAKPDAYILKASVYAALAMEAKTKNTPAAIPLMNEADASFKKIQGDGSDYELIKQSKQPDLSKWRCQSLFSFLCCGL